jgi:hypothetical protein
MPCTIEQNFSKMFVTTKTYSSDHRHKSVNPFINLIRLTNLSLLITVCATAAVPPTAAHPRIVLSSEKLAQLQARATANSADWLAVKKVADKMATYPVLPYTAGTRSYTINLGYRGSGYLDAIEHLGVAYRVTKHPQYGLKAIEVLKELDKAGLCVLDKVANNLCGIDSGNGYPLRFYGVAMALGYDWVYDLISPADRTAFVTQINEWMDWCENNCYQKDGDASNNFFSGYFHFLGLSGYATWGDNVRAVDYVTKAEHLYQIKIASEFSSGGRLEGGNVPEGYAYGSEAISRYLHYLLAVKSSTATYPPLTVGTANLASYTHALKPSRWQIIDNGDWGGDRSGVVLNVLPYMMSELLDGSAEGPRAQALANAIRPLPNGAFYSPSVVDTFLYMDSSRLVQQYGLGEPLTYRIPASETFLMRSDWTDSAVWLSFAAGARYITGHQNKDAGNITIQRGQDYLLVDGSQYRSGSGSSGTPAGNLGNQNENTLQFADQGDYNYTGAAYTGGQGVWGDNNILNYEDSPAYTYVRSNLTSAYDITTLKQDPSNRSLISYTRALMYLRPDITIIQDIVNGRKATYTKRLRFHFPSPVVKSGNNYTVTSGTSRLEVSTIAPAQVSIGQGAIYKPGTTTPTVNYVEVQNTQAVNSASYLNVMLAVDAYRSITNVSRIEVTNGQFHGALIEKDMGYVVLMRDSLDEQPAAEVSYKVAESFSGTHLLVGMLPGGRYDVKRAAGVVTCTSAATGAYTASAAGVLNFAAQVTSDLPTSTGSVVVKIDPNHFSVKKGTSVQVKATVTGTSTTALTWKVRGVVGGNATYGTISTTGVYKPPMSFSDGQVMVVTAVLKADPTKYANALATLRY